MATTEGAETSLQVRPDASATALEGSTGKVQLDRLLGLPVEVEARIALPGFRVSDLLALEPGKVIASEYHHNDDVPLQCGGVRLVWAEFEVVDQTLALRVTRLV